MHRAILGGTTILAFVALAVGITQVTADADPGAHGHAAAPATPTATRPAPPGPTAAPTQVPTAPAPTTTTSVPPASPAPQPAPGPQGGIANGGFEQVGGGWTASAPDVFAQGVPGLAHTGKGALLLGAGPRAGGWAQQSFVVPPHGRLSYWLRISTAATTTTRITDALAVWVADDSGHRTRVAYHSNTDATNDFVLRQADLSAYVGRTVRLTFVSAGGGTTAFVVDDVAVG